MSREIILLIFRSTRLCVTACGIMHRRCCRPIAGNIVGALYHKHRLCYLQRSVSPLCPSWRPAMLLAAFCIPTVSLLKTGYAIWSVLYPQCVPPEDRLCYLQRSVSPLCPSWRPAMILAAFCIPTVSLLKTSYATCSVLYPHCVPPEDQLCYLQRSVSPLCPSWRPAMLFAAFCIPSVSLLTKSGMLQHTTAQLTTFYVLEFQNSPIVLLFGALETEMLKSSLKKPQINKQISK